MLFMSNPAIISILLAHGHIGFPCQSQLVDFSFKARAPLYVGDRLRLRGSSGEAENSVKLVAYRPDGQVAMTAEVR